MISVVMATYNGEKFIKDQIMSIINQTIVPDELVICDDCSTDKTIDIIKEIAERQIISINLIRNSNNLGVTKNFENGCNLAKGEIIFFCDQDDLWEVDKVEKQLEVYKNNPQCNLVFTNAILFDNNSIYKDTLWDRFGFRGRKARVFKKSQLSAILMDSFVTGATMSAKKSFINNCIPFNNKFLHDEWLSFVASIDNSMLSVDKTLTHYRQHSQQVVGSKKLSIIEKAKNVTKSAEMIEKLEIMNNYLKGNKLVEQKIGFYKIRETANSKNFIMKFLSLTSAFLSFKYYKFKNKAFAAYVKDVLKFNKG